MTMKPLPIQLQKLPTWLSDPNIKTLFDCLDASGITGRFVGGCVRDFVVGRPVNDFDVAVDQRPEDVITALKKASIKVVPTGLSHGTVTAVINHHPFELTTLRKDVETDGRHAVVEFTDDWREDAARRDFTMNALYLDRDGRLYDYFDGLKDAQSGHVRFAGDPALRMLEDGLRLLRYFRFSAHFSKRDFDRDILDICAKFSPNLKKLAAERIWQEWAKTVTAENIYGTLRAMNDAEIFGYLYRKVSLSIADKDIERIKKINGSNKNDPIVSLATLHWGETSATVKKINQSLKLSNKDSHFLNALFLPHHALNIVGMDGFYSCYEKLGAKVVQAICLIESANETAGDWDHVWQYAAHTGDPVFPLQGRDLLNKGVEAGPQVGKYLNKVKEIWTEAGFKLDRAKCLVILDKIMEES